MRVQFRLNGRAVAAEVAAEETLIETLRDRFALGGARESCGQGLCGCCTVLIDGRAVSSCLYFSALVEGRAVITIEGLAAADSLDPLQEAFIAAGAFQCGFCTPGFVLMAMQLLDEHADPSEDQIRHYLSGNLCRCGSYPQIIEAVKLAARARRSRG